MWRVSVFSLQGTVWKEVLELTDDTILLDPFAGRLKWALGYNVGYHNRKPLVNLHIYLKNRVVFKKTAYHFRFILRGTLV